MRKVSDMARCEDCVHFKMCAWCIDAEHCAFFDTMHALKVESAKEILEEIESLFDKYPILYSIGEKTLAELKKKYTKGETDGLDKIH